MLKPEQVPDMCAQEAYRVWFKQGATWKDVVAAAINAWPGAERIYRSEDEKLFTIILSLPQEASDD